MSFYSIISVYQFADRCINSSGLLRYQTNTSRMRWLRIPTHSTYPLQFYCWWKIPISNFRVRRAAAPEQALPHILGLEWLDNVEWRLLTKIVALISHVMYRVRKASGIHRALGVLPCMEDALCRIYIDNNRTIWEQSYWANSTCSITCVVYHRLPLDILSTQFLAHHNIEVWQHSDECAMWVVRYGDGP